MPLPVEELLGLRDVQITREMVERDVAGPRKGSDLILESCFGVLDAG